MSEGRLSDENVPVSVPQSRMSNELPAAGVKGELMSETCSAPPRANCPVTRT